MPLVFVHGVSNRWSADYTRGIAARDALFREFLLRDHRPADGRAVAIRNPYWGGFGGRLHWGGASVPRDDFESLGAEDTAYAEMYVAADPDGSATTPAEVVLAVARRSLPDAVDLLWSAAALGERDEAGELAELAGPAYRYARSKPHPDWVDTIRTDQELVTRLEQEIATASDGSPAAAASDSEYESLGLGPGWNAVRRGLGRLRSAVPNYVGRRAADKIRSVAVPPVTGFLGDVFVYLHEQHGVARPIGELVEVDLRAAAAERTPADPFVVVAHSMGGNIVYDVLTSTGADVEVDLLVTVGSQVGFFEELKLFRASNRAVPGDDPKRKLPRPPAVRRWINIFDYSDLLGFEVGSIIDGVVDYSYRTDSPLRAHGQYFLQPSFHERLAERAGANDG
ncbi:hypothetical protein [Jidongwangia harbinensis]|uniref:hypothetical protein n=1 Tax=Jidongwangia harbinensis TaxID=2878561 RepID=UPI001CDA3636|nr:hypothetical protein [Jidongwangia harbinensis]MCA2218033.1 hypothetical protein [Jidongwangia harbinensis]